MLMLKWKTAAALTATCLVGLGAFTGLAPAARSSELSAASTADDAKDKSSKEDADKDKIEGTWKVISSTVGGVDESDPPDFRLTFDGESLAIQHGDRGFKGTFALDPSKRPKTIDLKFTDGPHAGDSMLGIYAWDGPKLKLCLAQPKDTDRPKEFTTTVQSGHRLFVLQKE